MFSERGLPLERAKTERDTVMRFGGTAERCCRSVLRQFRDQRIALRKQT